MTDLSELIERLKTASGPDRGLDEAVALALCDDHFFAQLADASEGTGCEMYRFGHHGHHSVLRVTASIDAALALVERCLPGWFVDHMGADVAGSIGDMKTFGWTVEVSDGLTGHQGQATTLPLAILLALLTALQSLKDKS